MERRRFKNDYIDETGVVNKIANRFSQRGGIMGLSDEDIVNALVEIIEMIKHRRFGGAKKEPKLLTSLGIAELLEQLLGDNTLNLSLGLDKKKKKGKGFRSGSGRVRFEE